MNKLESWKSTRTPHKVIGLIVVSFVCFIFFYGTLFPQKSTMYGTAKPRLKATLRQDSFESTLSTASMHVPLCKGFAGALAKTKKLHISDAANLKTGKSSKTAAAISATVPKSDWPSLKNIDRTCHLALALHSPQISCQDWIDSRGLASRYPGVLNGAENLMSETYKIVTNKYLSSREIVNILLKNSVALNRKFVNIGACQCEYADPACMLIGLDFTGMLLEGDSDNIEVLNRNYGDKKDFTIISALVDPENVIGYLQTDKSITHDFDFLKIDIDGIDGPILQRIMACGYRPKIIALEIAHWATPPIKFAVHYAKGYYGKAISNIDRDDDSRFYHGSYMSPFYGMSIAWVSALLRPLGYVPLQMELYNVVYIQQQYLKYFGDIPTDDETVFYMGRAVLAERKENEKMEFPYAAVATLETVSAQVQWVWESMSEEAAFFYKKLGVAVPFTVDI